MKLPGPEGITAPKEMNFQTPNCIPAETIQLVENIFLLNLVFRQTPRKCHFLAVRDNSKKWQIQKKAHVVVIKRNICPI